jgi:hypothetical protein
MISLGRVLGPLWGGYLYDLNMDFAFYSGAVMLAIGWVVSCGCLKGNIKIP